MNFYIDYRKKHIKLEKFGKNLIIVVADKILKYSSLGINIDRM